MKHFTIDHSYLTNITIYKEWNSYKNKTDPSEEDLIKVLQGKGKCSTTYSEDHPEFSKLRNQLESEGYITTIRNYVNGDRVVEEFYLNNVKFRKGEQFPCAPAMRHHIEYKIKLGS